MLVFGAFLSLLVVAAEAVSRPPGIFIQPDFNIYYKVRETVQLPCVAEGEPRPSYEWQRNEIAFNPSGNDDRIVQLPNAGTLVINTPEDKDEGIFQCFAVNDFGRSASIKVNLRMGMLKDFNYQDDTYHTPELGKPYTLDCVPPESVPPASVFWIIKNPTGGFDALNYDDRVTMDREYGLRFTSIKIEDFMNGQPYACMAMNNLMRSNTQGPLHFITPEGNTEQFQEVDYMWSDQDDRFGLRGETFTVKCVFSGNPTPDVHWERTDNKSLSDRAQIKSFSQELQIENLQFEDEGTYECWATNTISQKRKIRTFNLRVNSKPFFDIEPQDVETGVGANVEFICTAIGVPKPRIDWFINGRKLADVTDERITGPRFKHPVDTKIYIENVEQTDHMVLQCNASNTHGYAFADVYLNVLSEAPTILTAPKALEISAEGLKVNLTCETTGKPDPIITWYKDGEQITGGRYGIMLNGDLYIRKVVLSDAGHYRCQAENIFNTTSASGRLVVRRKTRIEQRPMDLERTAGMDAKFTCSGTTDPEEVDKLRIEWLKDNKKITSNDQRMTTNIQDNSLTISGTIVRDSGTYTCVATNGLDSSRASAVLTVKDRPDAPTKVYHQDCNKEVTVHWMPGSFNNAPVQYYMIEYNTPFNPNDWTFALKVNGSKSQVNVALSPYMNYTFRVIAYNKIGESEPSFPTPSVCTTKADRPAYHPKNLRTIGHQPNTLFIEWTPVPPMNQNGPGFYYILQVLRDGDPSSNLQSIPINKWQRKTYEIKTGLVYEPYEITIKSVNSVGEAGENPTTIIGHSYESTPSIIPTNFLTQEIEDTYVIFSWDFLKSEIGKKRTKIRGEFMGFKIQFWQENYKALTIREHDIGPDSQYNTTGNTFSARVGNMLPNTNMMARISVKNNFYVGPPSESIRFTTQAGFPGPVAYFRPLVIGDTHVYLEWGSPEENRGDLEGYDISYRLVNGLDLGEMQERAPQINDPYTVNAYLSGLKPRSRYRVYISARTRKGRGESYFIEVVTTKPGTPRTPRFTIANVGSTYINVTWWVNAYDTSGTVVFVEYRKIDGAEWLRSTDEVIHMWKNISNLESGTKYEVRIKATNGQISVASGIAEVTTDGTAKAYDLVGNIGWFLGMLFSILLIIALIVFFILCYKRGFRFNHQEQSGYTYRNNEPYSGTYDNTTRVAQGSDFGPEPKGYSNDYYNGQEYQDFDDGGFAHRPPSYRSDQAYNKEYEAYDRKPSRDYDPEYDSREPNKFDKSGVPWNDHSQRDYDYDRRDDPRDYDYDRRDDPRDYDYDRRHDYDPRDYDYDQRDDYDRRDYDYDDRDYDRRDYNDDRRHDYDDHNDSYKVPSAPPSEVGKSSSTFV